MVNDFCQARKAENTDPRINYAVKYGTARGRLTFDAIGTSRAKPPSANVVFQACTSSLRHFTQEPGAPIRKILVYTGMPPCLVP